LRRALNKNRFPPEVRSLVERLIECAKLLGPAIHVQSDYGDEIHWRTPWELFDESVAQQALSLAEEAVLLAKQIAQGN